MKSDDKTQTFDTCWNHTKVLSNSAKK